MKGTIERGKESRRERQTEGGRQGKGPVHNRGDDLGLVATTHIHTHTHTHTHTQ